MDNDQCGDTTSYGGSFSNFLCDNQGAKQRSQQGQNPSVIVNCFEQGGEVGQTDVVHLA